MPIAFASSENRCPRDRRWNLSRPILFDIPVVKSSDVEQHYYATSRQVQNLAKPATAPDPKSSPIGSYQISQNSRDGLMRPSEESIDEVSLESGEGQLPREAVEKRFAKKLEVEEVIAADTLRRRAKGRRMRQQERPEAAHRAETHTRTSVNGAAFRPPRPEVDIEKFRCELSPHRNTLTEASETSNTPLQALREQVSNIKELLDGSQAKELERLEEPQEEISCKERILDVAEDQRNPEESPAQAFLHRSECETAEGTACRNTARSRTQGVLPQEEDEEAAAAEEEEEERLRSVPSSTIEDYEQESLLYDRFALANRALCRSLAGFANCYAAKAQIWKKWKGTFSRTSWNNFNSRHRHLHRRTAKLETLLLEIETIDAEIGLLLGELTDIGLCRALFWQWHLNRSTDWTYELDRNSHFARQQSQNLRHQWSKTTLFRRQLLAPAFKHVQSIEATISGVLDLVSWKPKSPYDTEFLDIGEAINRLRLPQVFHFNQYTSASSLKAMPLWSERYSPLVKLLLKIHFQARRIAMEMNSLSRRLIFSWLITQSPAERVHFLRIIMPCAVFSQWEYASYMLYKRTFESLRRARKRDGRPAHPGIASLEKSFRGLLDHVQEPLRRLPTPLMLQIQTPQARETLLSQKHELAQECKRLLEGETLIDQHFDRLLHRKEMLKNHRKSAEKICKKLHIARSEGRDPPISRSDSDDRRWRSKRPTQWTTSPSGGEAVAVVWQPQALPRDLWRHNYRSAQSTKAHLLRLRARQRGAAALIVEDDSGWESPVDPLMARRHETASTTIPQVRRPAASPEQDPRTRIDSQRDRQTEVMRLPVFGPSTNDTTTMQSTTEPFRTASSNQGDPPTWSDCETAAEPEISQAAQQMEPREPIKSTSTSKSSARNNSRSATASKQPKGTKANRVVKQKERAGESATLHASFRPTQPWNSPFNFFSYAVAPNENTEQKDEDPGKDVQENSEEPEYEPLTYQIPDEVLRNAMRASPSSMAAFWSHKMYRSPTGKEVILNYCSTKQAGERVAQEFTTKKALGFDIEWKSNATAADGMKANVSLVQLACEERVGLFHLSLYHGKTADEIVPATLRQIIESPDILKCGVHVLGDGSRIKTNYGITPRGLFELSHTHNLLKAIKTKSGNVSRKSVALSTLAQEYLQLPLYKGGVRTSDWSKPLQHEQSSYAATDAYASFMLFHALEAKRLALDPVPGRPACAEEGKPIVLPNTEKTDSSDEYASAEGVEDSELESAEEELSDADSSDGRFSDDDSSKIAENFHQLRLMPLPEESVPRDEDTLSSEYETAEEYVTQSPGGGNQDNPKPDDFVGRLKLIKDGLPQAESAWVKRPEVLQADAWVAEFENIKSSKLPKPYKPRVNSSQLRAYAMWFYQNLTVAQIASLMREKPLKASTVAAYILDCILLERLPYDGKRAKALFEDVPWSLQGRYNSIRRSLP